MLHILSTAITLAQYAVTVVQYISMLISFMIITPVIMLLAWDLMLYAMRLVQLKQVGINVVVWFHELKSSTRGLWTMKLKRIGKRQMYNQKVICEASIAG